jgi:hypothetical protein
MTKPTYPPPLDQLLALGRPEGDWPDYPGQYGLTAAHVPDLIRMMQDSTAWDEEIEDETWVYANIHAWRALGQLGDMTAFSPLLEMLTWVEEYDDDWTATELPEVFGLLGVETIPTLGQYLRDSKNGMWARATACDGLETVAKRHPESAPECAQLLADALADYALNDPVLNGMIVISLAELRQPSTYAVVEEAFKANRVDLMAMGDWEDFQVAVGLLEKRISAPNQPWLQRDEDVENDPVQTTREKSAVKKEKNKRKQEKKSRKQNRKKKR